MIVEKSSGGREDLPAQEPGRYTLEHQNWIPAEDVKVSFDILHDGSSIYLKYFVREGHVRAVNFEYNSAVWEDSCVEFFVSFDGDSGYYNFEFNAIGAVLGAYGSNRNNRTFISPAILEKIERHPSLGDETFGELKERTSWNIDIRIPVEALCFSSITELSGMQGHSNFYKCGDKLVKPHFLSWKPVMTEKPDFHLSQFFGNLDFE